MQIDHKYLTESGILKNKFICVYCGSTSAMILVKSFTHINNMYGAFLCCNECDLEMEIQYTRFR